MVAFRPSIALDARNAKRFCHSAMLGRLSRREVLQSDTAPSLQRLSCLGYASEKLRIVLQTIVEPIVLGLEANQHTGRLSVPRDQDLLGLGQAQKSRQIILDLSECDLAEPPSRAGRASSPLRLW